MSQRRGPRRDISSQRIMPPGRRGLLDPWEGPPGNQQSIMGSQTSLLGQLGLPNAQTAISDSLLSTINLLGRPELNQLQSLLALGAARVGQQLTSDLQPTFGGLNRGRLFNEGMRSRPPFSKRDSDRKKAVTTSRSRFSKEDGKDGGTGSRDHSDDKRSSPDGKQKKRKAQDLDSDEEEVTPYAGIPTESFYCHVCGKRMWDDKSFSNHVKGRAHLSLMDLREQFYKIQVDLMRHELKLAESLRNIEMDRIRRRGKTVRPLAQEYCTMCDLHFFGNIVAHRKQSSHQTLKKFLHPCCNPCEKEFHTRIEWDEHKLSPDHMKKCPDSGEDIKLDPSITLEDFDVDEKAKEEVLADGATITGGISAMIRRLVPKFNPDAGFAPKMVVPVEGFECHRCKFFFKDEESAILHSQTKTHYENCVAYEKRKSKRAVRFNKPTKKIQDDGEEATKENPNVGEDVVNADADTTNETMDTTTGDTIILQGEDEAGEEDDETEMGKGKE